MKRAILITSFALSMLFATTALADTGSWSYDQNTDKWHYYNSNGFDAYGWNWIDGDNDGVYEHYYFDNDGCMLADTYTPDGQYVNSNGARELDGQVAVLDNRALLSTPYAAYSQLNDNIFSYINFSASDIIDHGSYYEIPNQYIYREIPNDDYFDCETIYAGSVYLYKNIVSPNSFGTGEFVFWEEGIDTFPYSEYAYAFNGTYAWTLMDMDSKGYYTSFIMQQLP